MKTKLVTMVTCEGCGHSTYVDNDDQFFLEKTTVLPHRSPYTQNDPDVKCSVRYGEVSEKRCIAECKRHNAEVEEAQRQKELVLDKIVTQCGANKAIQALVGAGLTDRELFASIVDIVADTVGGAAFLFDYPTSLRNELIDRCIAAAQKVVKE